MQKYTGHCHCGKVTYEVETDLEKVIECNCSHCSAKGLLLAFVPPEQFALLHGEDNLTEYRFNTERIAHLFCRTCGVQSFARGQKRDGTPIICINVRCLDNVDPQQLERTAVNGKDY